MNDASSNPKPAQPKIRLSSAWISEFAGTLLYEAGFANTDTDKDELMEILRALEDSREEGRSLYPEIIISSRLDECLEPIYPKQVIVCGEIKERKGRIKQAIKRCASLAVDPWVIFLDVTKKRLRYGVASSTVMAETASLPERIFDAFSEESALPLVHLRRHGGRAIFVRTPKQRTVVSLTLSEELLEGQAQIDQFADVIVSDVVEARRDGSSRIISGLLTQASREGHGLPACVLTQSNLEAARKLFPDGAYLDPLLVLCADQRDEHSGSVSLELDSALRARVLLGRQMVETDLMTVFSTEGQLVGYNVHIPNSGATPGSVGGARTRAFEALKKQSIVRAAFVCSQDGQTKLHV